MCGIVGYVGPREAVPILLEGLARLEYRGYDSAGVALQNGAGLQTRKLAGRVQGLADLLSRDPVHGTCGIAHTRWATHGGPTDGNAHPHTDCNGEFALVHNGIVENADVLRRRLEPAGHRFTTETDTEVIAHLIEDAAGDTLEERVIAALAPVEGTYGLAVTWAAEPGKIVVARRGSPVLLGVGDGEHFVASDASAVLGHTRSVVYLQDGDIAVLTADGYRVLDRDAVEQERAVDAIEWDLEALALGPYPHFMLKEICEQTETVRNTLRGRLLPGEGFARLNGLNLSPGQCMRIRRILIVACGTSWHSGLVGRHALEELAGIPVDVEYASEYRYRRQLQIPGTLTIAVSQSGETADTLEALRAARATGSAVVGVVNVVGSTIAREADGGIYLHAGPEIGVASTKAFTSQVVALLVLGLYLARQRGVMAVDEGRRLVAEFERLPELVSRALELEPQVKEVAAAYAGAGNALYLGRGVNYPVALEGALKLREATYLSTEGHDVEGILHGPLISLSAEDSVVVIAHPGASLERTAELTAALHEIGTSTVAVGPSAAGLPATSAQLETPAIDERLAAMVNVVPLQWLALEVSRRLGVDADSFRKVGRYADAQSKFTL